MKTFSSNRELYEYLLFLRSELKQRGSEELSETVAAASRHASSMSTEFLGESRTALEQVLKYENGLLTEQDRADLSDVLKQLGEALDKR